MQIEEGKCYTARNGKSYGPMCSTGYHLWAWTISARGRLGGQTRLWRDDGTFVDWRRQPSPYDLLAETPPSSAPNKAPGEKKYDLGKVPMFRGLLNRFPRALKKIAEISAFGYGKYGTFDGWERVENAEQRYEDALLRHLQADAAGELVDPESHELHLAHAAWNALAILELALRRLGPK